MQSTAATPQEYIDGLPEDRKEAVTKLRDVILQNLAPGFREGMGYGMIGWAVPHSVYPAGYHCDPKLPLPFLSIASQKNFVALYHMGLYANSKLLDWFVAEYPKYVKTKLDMGKGCVRFKKPEAIPYSLIGELVAKMDAQEWIAVYEAGLKKK
jgi:uncharacterized protein YdhG (YjbR/CyaY superfamily)